MQKLIALMDEFDIAFACDTDHDRHGIVTKSAGLLPSNHYLAVCVHYLFSHRPQMAQQYRHRKNSGSSGMIDRVAGEVGRRLYEVPLGFKWFVRGLLDDNASFFNDLH